MSGVYKCIKKAGVMVDNLELVMYFVVFVGSIIKACGG